MTERKKRNIIIGSLCTVLLLMVVGYAAFQSVLKIKGTSTISSNWDIKITSITSDVLHGSATNAKDPEGVGTLTASFEINLVSPGDSIKYTITVANQGNINAKLDKITLSEPDNEYVTFETSGLTEGEPLNAGSTADLIVTVTFKDVEINKMDKSTSKLTVTLDYSQADGNSSDTPAPDNRVVYRWTTQRLGIGDSIEGVETTTDPSTFGKKHYLKHEINSENKIIASYVCFITDTEHCMQGGDNGAAFETNKALLQGQQSWFTRNGGSCTFGDYCYCSGGDFVEINTISTGNVRAYDSSESYCYVGPDGVSTCTR